VKRMLCVEVDGVVKDGDILAVASRYGEVIVLSHGWK